MTCLSQHSAISSTEFSAFLHGLTRSARSPYTQRVLRRSVLCTLKLSLFYGALLALSIAVPAIGAMLGKAKWLHLLLSGIAAGLATERIAKIEGLIAIALFSLLLSCGWTAFSAFGKGLEAERILLLFLMSLPVMAAGGLSVALGLLGGQKLRRRASETKTVSPSAQL
jgi:hypothetical protein